MELQFIKYQNNGAELHLSSCELASTTMSSNFYVPASAFANAFTNNPCLRTSHLRDSRKRLTCGCLFLLPTSPMVSGILVGEEDCLFVFCIHQRVPEGAEPYVART